MRSNKRVKMEHEFRESFRQAKKLKRNDPFTRLPDQVIASHILSRFTLEEGARYCILSHRWKNLWASTIGSKLIFAPEHLRIDERAKLLAELKPNFPGRRRKRSEIQLSRQAMDRLPLIETVSNRIKRLRPCFERWISNVLQGYSMPELDELCVRFPFDSRNNDSIDTWVECALKKGITRLELDLIQWDVEFSRGVEVSRSYMFPKIDKFQGMLANCVGLNLRDVRLKRVFICADVIEFMVAHFPIERLSIEFSTIFKQLNISGESVRLKTLDLISTRIHVRAVTICLRISASSLTSLTFSGRESELLLEHVPRLTELSVDKEFCTTFLPLGLQQRVYMAGLKRLELAMSGKAVRSSIDFPLEFTTTLNLEELKVEIHGRKEACFLWPVVLINAAPFLRKFTVKLHTSPWSGRHIWDDDYENVVDRQFRRRLNPIRSAAKHVRHHKYLKKVELHNFTDHRRELELVRHLLPVETLEQILISSNHYTSTLVEVIATGLPPASKAKLIIL